MYAEIVYMYMYIYVYIVLVQSQCMNWTGFQNHTVSRSLGFMVFSDSTVNLLVDKVWKLWFGAPERNAPLHNNVLRDTDNGLKKKSNRWFLLHLSPERLLEIYLKSMKFIISF